MKTTGGDLSWLNVKNERHNRSIHNMVIAGLLESNQHTKYGGVNQIHQHNSIYVKSTVDSTITNITLHGMVKA